ncbi:MAG: DUF2142 domain-containing protein [Candidatus Hydrogenedens sp.]|nr:DUF2142 domain-containing protein [Candidatus Hydrogenedens sp.]
MTGFSARTIRITVACSLGLAAGICCLFVLPPLMTPDSLGHWLRSVQVSQGQLISTRLGPNRWGGEVDGGALRFGAFLIDRYRADQVASHAEVQAVATAIEGDPPAGITTDFSTAAAFPPLAYLAQAGAIALARAAGADWLMACRLAGLGNLLLYTMLVAAALVRLPAFDRIAAALAFAPFALTQSASVSADPLNFALPLLLFAICWQARLERGPVSRRRLIGLAALFLGVVLLKPPNVAFLALSLLIPADRFGGGRRRMLILAVLALPALAVLAAWTMAFPFRPGAYFDTGADPAAQIDFILTNPLRALGIVVDTAVWRALRNWYNANAMFGPGYGEHFRLGWPFPALTLVLFAGLALHDGPGRRDWTAAGLCSAVAILFFLIVLAAFWLTFTSPGDSLVRGMQGRYFWICFLLVLASGGLAVGRRTASPELAATLTGAVWGVHAAMLIVVILHYGAAWGTLPAVLPS